MYGLDSISLRFPEITVVPPNFNHTAQTSRLYQNGLAILEKMISDNIQDIRQGITRKILENAHSATVTMQPLDDPTQCSNEDGYSDYLYSIKIEATCDSLIGQYGNELSFSEIRTRLDQYNALSSVIGRIQSDTVGYGNVIHCPPSQYPQVNTVGSTIQRVTIGDDVAVMLKTMLYTALAKQYNIRNIGTSEFNRTGTVTVFLRPEDFSTGKGSIGISYISNAIRVTRSDEPKTESNSQITKFEDAILGASTDIHWE